MAGGAVTASLGPLKGVCAKAELIMIAKSKVNDAFKMVNLFFMSVVFLVIFLICDYRFGWIWI